MALEPILIVPDTHRPYHDERAWKLLLKVGKVLRPKHIIIMGDFLDCYSISAYSKDPRRIANLEAELEIAKRGLDDLDALKARHKIFIAGNHCDRLRRYLQEKAPELFGLVDIPQLLDLRQRGWAYVPYKSDTRLGKLYITHDVGTAGRGSTFRALDTYQHSIITGHAHRICYVVEGNAAGEYKLSGQFGWLGDVSKVDYMHQVNARKNWALGFGVGYLDSSTGIVYLTPVPIVRYTCAVNGKLYRG